MSGSTRKRSSLLRPPDGKTAIPAAATNPTAATTATAANLVEGASGLLTAEKFPREGAGILSSFVAADGLVELPEDLTRPEAGAMVEFLPFSEAAQ